MTGLSTLRMAEGIKAGGGRMEEGRKRQRLAVRSEGWIWRKHDII